MIRRKCGRFNSCRARQIVEACRHGRAELVITVQAKLAILTKDLAPELFADVMTFISELLPPPASGADGDVARRGRESESEWADPSRR